MTEMNEWMRAERSERALAVFIPFLQQGKLSSGFNFIPFSPLLRNLYN